MSDLIERRAAIAVIENRKPLFTTLEYVKGINNGLAEAQNILKEMPAADISEQLENAYAHGYTAAEAEFRKVMEAERWIPVSERLPEGYEEILMCDKQGNISTGGYCGGERPFEDNYGYYMDEVIAWRPLPEPYRGAEE